MANIFIHTPRFRREKNYHLRKWTTSSEELPKVLLIVQLFMLLGEALAALLQRLARVVVRIRREGGGVPILLWNCA